MNKNFFTFETYEEHGERIELTAVLTNYLLREGILINRNDKDYINELKTLKFLAVPDERLEKAMGIFQKIRSSSSKQIFNRYEAIKNELKKFNPENLVIGATGLSPLGYVYALENPYSNIFDTDLFEIISYRKDKLSRIKNYTLKELDLLKKGNIKKFIEDNIIKGKTAFVVEGLTFYLNQEMQKIFHNNLQEAITKDIHPSIFIFEYYTSNKSANETDSNFVPRTQEEKDYKTMFSSIGNNQGMRAKTNEEVAKFLKNMGYKKANLSKYTYEENPQKIWVCK